MTLSAEEFLRRFFLHVLPKGFVRIRFYGFLGASLPHRGTATLPARARCESTARGLRRRHVHPVALPPCPRCGGVMVAFEQLTARQLAVQLLIEGLALDSS